MFTTIGTLKITVRQAGSSVQAGFTVQVALVICGLESSNWLIHIGKIVVDVYFLGKMGFFKSANSIFKVNNEVTHLPQITKENSTVFTLQTKIERNVNIKNINTPE
jgi:hypothetical protein